MNVPNSGKTIEIQSYKHSGSLHRVWKETTILKGTSQIAIGGNDKTEVKESDGRSWITREPAICYFHAECWFNVIGMLRQDGIYYYCNLSSPFTWDEGMLKYIDYDLDVKVFPDMTYIILDEDEYALHKEEMDYPEAIDEILQRNMQTLIHWIHQRKGPFAPGFVDDWYEYFLTFRS
ncbi:DUF402 domain-containing protein [Bacillus tianshenii]|nr:DUF402 domain-containing protein [Bacillus tianshenii]